MSCAGNPTYVYSATSSDGDRMPPPAGGGRYVASCPCGWRCTGDKGFVIWAGNIHAAHCPQAPS